MRDKLILWFIANCPEHYKAMLNSNHYVDPLIPNPYHGEGSIWTHTMMVMTYINCTIKNDAEKILLLATALLHDIGKPSCEESQEASDTKPTRNSFKGHEGVSTFISIEILKRLSKDFPDQYDAQSIKTILTLVSTHGVALEQETSKLNTLRRHFRLADKYGAVRETGDKIQSQYSSRKYLPYNPTPLKEVVVLVGPPNSGKSTIRSNYPNHHIISRDDALFNFYALKIDEFAKPTYSEVYSAIHTDPVISESFNIYWQNHVNLARNQAQVLIDMTMMSLSSRRKMLHHFKNHTRKAVVLMTDMPTLANRELIRAKTGKIIPPYVYYNMIRSFVIPVKEEGFEEIQIILGD